ncbi:MAG: undecaprenyl-diphosphatase UppP [Candidatus Zambryskibacteria bacterium]|nr:undecaprenyl-diphosphatase UppP [Candidatus Zambryskibacteria bacterium]
MGYIDAIILGAVQGLTEFLPVSSSGHLLIARAFLNLPLAGTLTFDAVLQCATVLAVLIYFSRDLWGIVLSGIRFVLQKPISHTEKTYLWAIVLGTIPAIVFGLLLESKMDSMFRNIHLVAAALLAGSALMYAAQKYAEETSPRGTLGETTSPMSDIGENQGLTVKKGIIIGFFQSLALVPGISRSGATISGGLFAGLSREEATRFSFLLSVPILVGSGLKKLLEVNFGAPDALLGPLFLGSLVSFIIGLLAIHYFIKYLKNHTLTAFIWYRIILAVALFIFM